MSYMIMSALLTTTTGVLAYLAGRRDGRHRRHMRTSEPRLLGRGYRTTTEKMNSQLPEDTK